MKTRIENIHLEWPDIFGRNTPPPVNVACISFETEVNGSSELSDANLRANIYEAWNLVSSLPDEWDWYVFLYTPELKPSRITRYKKLMGRIKRETKNAEVHLEPLIEEVCIESAANVRYYTLCNASLDLLYACHRLRKLETYPIFFATRDHLDCEAIARRLDQAANGEGANTRDTIWGPILREFCYEDIIFFYSSEYEPLLSIGCDLFMNTGIFNSLKE